jgi:hypothetical protein
MPEFIRLHKRFSKLRDTMTRQTHCCAASAEHPCYGKVTSTPFLPQAASLIVLAKAFGRDISALSHALSRIEVRSRKSPAFAKSLQRHIHAISQA